MYCLHFLSLIGVRVEGRGLSQCVLFVCGVAPSELKRQRIHPYVYGLISGGNFLYPKEDLVVPLGGVRWGRANKDGEAPLSKKNVVLSWG